MALHLVKLCVGAESIADLEQWISQRMAARRKKGEPAEHYHTTRMVPKRVDELTDGGSLYWVIKGQISARQRLIGIRPFVDSEGISRCHLLLEPEVIQLVPRPMRPFQGWRYLKPADAPQDLGAAGESLATMPEELRRELRELGLL